MINIARKGQTLIQYFLVAILIIGVAFVFVPMLQEANTALINAPPKDSSEINMEGILTEPPPSDESITPGTSAFTPTTPPVPPGAGPAPTGTMCGPFGCGTVCTFLTDVCCPPDPDCAEKVCGVIPGPAGVLDDGCWICDHVSEFWFWETNLTTCQDYWHSGLASLCSAACTYDPPFVGPDLFNRYCYICTLSSPK